MTTGEPPTTESSASATTAPSSRRTPRSTNHRDHGSGDHTDDHAAPNDDRHPSRLRRRPPCPNPYPVVDSVTASTVRPGSTDACGDPTSYEPFQVSDGLTDTAWMAPGDGAGQSVTLYLTGASEVRELSLLPGYDKFDPCSNRDRFFDLRRITEVQWAFDDGSTVTHAIAPDPAPVFSTVRLSRPVVTSTITMTIVSTTPPGVTGLDHTPVSEIVLGSRSVRLLTVVIVLGGVLLVHRLAIEVIRRDHASGGGHVDDCDRQLDGRPDRNASPVVGDGHTDEHHGARCDRDIIHRPPPAPRTTSDASMRTTTTTIAETAGTPITAAAPRQSGHTAYVLPVADIDLASWGQTHGRGYPATDIFVGCGASIVSPVTGVVLEVRFVDAYDPAVDNPATAGGLSISVLGDDGVRYYLAHFRLILDAIQPEVRVTAGQRLGEMGDTGRASACHVHFGLSPPCPGKEWSVRFAA